jgi:DNA-binding GntR family transcriptional regulator
MVRMKIQKSDPLYLQVYTLLRDELTRGHYKPGEKLVESKLAAKYEVSRGPIREAMGRLEQEGLIVQKGNYSYVIEFTKKDVMDLYQCRKALESMAAELATIHITEEELVQLKEALNKSEAALKKANSKEVVHYNTLFHDTIVNSSRNETLINILKGISGKILYYRNNIIGNYHRYDDFITEHKAIFNEIAKKDSIAAKKLMEHHIDSDIAAFLDFLNKNNVNMITR